MTDLQRRHGLAEGNGLPVAVLATLGDNPPPVPGPTQRLIDVYRRQS